MYRSRFFVVIAQLAFITLCATHSPAVADDFALRPRTQSAEVANFPLDERLLGNVEAAQHEIEALPLQPIENSGNDNSIDGLTTTISAQPSIVAVLKKHSLDPRTYVLALKALQSSFAAAVAADDKDAVFDDSRTVSPQNLDFAKKNIDRLRRLFDGLL